MLACRRSGTSQFVSGNRIHIPSFERSENRFEPDIELALQKVKSRRARMERLRHRIWQYAALILVALGLGIYGTYRFADRLDEVTDGVDAGSSRAILHLASGEK